MNKIMLDPSTMTEEQKRALVEGHYEAWRSYAEEQIIGSIRAAVAKGFAPKDLAAVVFDIDDPNTPARFVEEMKQKKAGVLTVALRREIVASMLARMEMPVPEAKVQWSKRIRQWTDSSGKPAEYVSYKPFEDIADKLSEPTDENEFWVVTVTQGTIGAGRLVLAQTESVQS